MTYAIYRKQQIMATGPYAPAQVKQMEKAGYDVKPVKQ